MVEQVRRFDALNECGQQIVAVVDNQEAIARISQMLEGFQERWEGLVQDMEAQSKEVRTYSTHCIYYMIAYFLTEYMT